MALPPGEVSTPGASLVAEPAKKRQRLLHAYNHDCLYIFFKSILHFSVAVVHNMPRN